MRSTQRLAVAATIVIAVLAAGCGGSDDGASTSTSAGATSTTPGVRGTPILLGSVQTLSAEGQTGFAVGDDALEAWADWVNGHGGINGHPVKVTIKDDRGDQAQSVAAVRALVEQEHVVALIGVTSGGLVAGWADYVQQKQMPVVGGTAFSPLWASHPMFFPGGTTFIEGASAGLVAAKQNGFKHFGAVFCAEAAQCKLAIDFTKAQAGKVGIDFAFGGTVSSTAADYTATCLAVEKAGVDILELGLPGFDSGVNFAKSCDRQGYHPAWDIPGQAISNKYLTTDLFDNAFNTPEVLPWFSDAPANKDFKAAMKAGKVNLTKATLPLSASDEWAAGLLFQKAVELSGATGIPTSADILAGMAKVKDETLGGFTPPLTFTDPANKAVPCYFIIKVQKRKFTMPQGTEVACNPAST